MVRESVSCVFLSCKFKINCTMDDVQGLFLRIPHGTTPAAVTTNKNIIMSSFKSSRDIQKKEGGPDSCFG